MSRFWPTFMWPPRFGHELTRPHPADTISLVDAQTMSANPQVAFSLNVLEFHGIIEILGRFLSGPLSRPALAAVAPRTEIAPIERDLDLAREAGDYLHQSPRLGLAGLADPRPVLEKLRIEGIPCSALEIFGVVEIARAASGLRENFRQTPYARLDELATGIANLSPLVREIGGKILPDGSVDSSASPELARIRRSIGRTRQQLQSLMEKLLHRLDHEQALQENLVTVRNGRPVLPVRAEKKRAVEGIVHGASSSGASIYVEPMEALPLNNELAELEDREAEEIRRILAEFSDRLRERRLDLIGATVALSEMDLAFAKAEFARQYRASIPQFSASRELVLREARHPLLESALRAAGHEPVPLTIELHPPQTLVVISGPNTGGKTVALKTIGVAALMAQAGLPVPAREARLPLFSRILADIGDQQSIEQNLSTFSAHIRNIQAMAAAAGGDDLVLLDEIGSSTDPQEGAALAIAILEHFRGRGAITIASTHHSRLKAYAADTPGAVNAAMDFDEATLAPTYQFLMGLPGKSSGLEIAQRIGLDPEIVNTARALIDPSQTETAALVAFLHAQKAAQETELARLRQQSREIEARESQMKERWMAERQAKLRELDKRLEETLQDYDKRWKTAIEQIRLQAQQAETKPPKALGRAGRKGESLGREAREEWNAQVLEAIGTPPASSDEISASPALGDRVRLRNLSTPGVVTAVLDKNELEVEVGRVRMRVPQSEVLVLARQHAEATSVAAPVAVAAVLPENDETAPVTEVNVIGNTAAEARARVDEFLDRAFLRGRFTIRIVHGYGKGVLRKELHEMFASHPHVERYYPAPQQEGGAGATIVELKR